MSFFSALFDQFFGGTASSDNTPHVVPSMEIEDVSDWVTYDANGIHNAHKTDPAYAHLPENIYHGTSMDPTYVDTVTDPTFANVPENVYHDTCFDQTSSSHMNFDDHTSDDSADSFGSFNNSWDSSCGSGSFSDSFGGGSDFGGGFGSGF